MTVRRRKLKALQTDPKLAKLNEAITRYGHDKGCVIWKQRNLYIPLEEQECSCSFTQARYFLLRPPLPARRESNLP